MTVEAETIATPESPYRCTVPDMECADCAVKVEGAIRRQRGVANVSVRLLGQKVTVDFDPASTDAEQIAAAIRDAGYTVAVDGAGAAAGEEKATASWNGAKARTALSGGLLAAGLIWGLARPGDGPGEGTAAVWQGAVGVADLLLLAAAVVGGYNFFPAGLRAARHLALDMDFLMTAAIAGAVVIGQYTEAASIAFLFSLAELLEDYAIDRARDSLRALMRLAPDTAVVSVEGTEREVPAAEVQIGDVLIVRPGSKVPVDGEVVEGASSVDEATITGESMPVTKQPGERVFAGTLNQEGYLEVRATHTAASSTLARIIEMVEEAEEHRAPSEQFVGRFARSYTPAVTVLAVAVMAVPPLVFDGAFETWFVRGLTLLVIACPCALVISTPVAVVGGITGAARHGVLIKGGSYLEALGDVRAVAFDKTGTLTQGKPEVTDVVPLEGESEDEILRLAAALEHRSQHPIARAILRRVSAPALPEVTDFESLPGQGVRGRIGDTTYLVGKPGLFGAAGSGRVEELAEQGKTVVLVGTEARAMGIIAVADTVRAAARESIELLHRRGIETVLLTGDNEQTARAIARQLGIAHWRAGLLPEDKVEAVSRLRSRLGEVAMVGDGVNDAPALAAASVGIAMGGAGSDTALETADVVLMADDLTRLPYLLKLSHSSRRVIRQNVWSSILIKFSLAAGVFPGLVSLATAVLVGDMGTSLGVIANALRLPRVRP